MNTAHAMALDYSPETGTIVACVCGLILGPFAEYKEARSAAAEHRRWTGAEVIGDAERRRERRRELDRERRARKAAARRAARAAEA